MSPVSAPAADGQGPAAAPSVAPPALGWADRLRRVLQRLRRGPDTLFGRLACLLAVVVVASHLLALSLMFELRGPPPPPPQPPMPPQQVQGETLSSPITVTNEKSYVVRRGLPLQLQPEGRPLPPQKEPQRSLWAFVLDVGFRLSALLIATWFGARWLATPMRRLAAAARELGGNINRPPLPETGTVECREASRVFNQMQDRIRQQLQDRDRLVAAVSHDLRTPLTRLRLRAELLDDQRTNLEFQRDIAEMDAMIQDTLDYLRGQAQATPMVRVQVQALLESVVDDHELTGVHIPLRGTAGIIQAQIGPLRRCVDNLIANALRYGGGAEVLLEESPRGVRITVRDHGPGMPDAALRQVMQPFVRLEASRHRHHGGVGLGLSIARDIALRHHGELRLHNAHDGGLCAVLELPYNQP
ncbi:ATP-binding protein [Comamonas sp. 17RB]|uniref:ATP-binding protein n=1 Tax=Comamonas sp. 17RB TaxID=3047025 RepID=UPI0024B66666|nr:ATP-binding protein [Comamonas sp. 17RB]MDI9857060.1 ATP-binding protein [Comamonas sp. 17RB]